MIPDYIFIPAVIVVEAIICVWWGIRERNRSRARIAKKEVMERMTDRKEGHAWVQHTNGQKKLVRYAKNRN